MDVDQDGHVDRVYFTDLDGRVWRANVSANFQNESSWPVTKIYEDAKNFPISSKPAALMKSGGYPRVYFGTGGDDTAPSDVKYSFIALIDKATPEVEWYLGDPLLLNLPVSKRSGVLDDGEKVWGDPVIANSVCYFNTLKGNIESVDPCENIIGVGKLYARYVESIAGAIFGATALKIETGPTESLQLEIKTRAAVTLGERQTTGSGVRKRAVYIQEYNSTIQKMEQAVLSSLKIRSWREIFRIMK
jgi:Tfp pilus tip-associated adhesin PilY1